MYRRYTNFTFAVLLSTIAIPTSHVELWRWVALFKGGNGLATDYFD
jgi:hypothetical protein